MTDSRLLRAALAVAAAAALAAAAPAIARAHSDPDAPRAAPRTFAARVLAQTLAGLDQLAAAHVPPPAPPTPIAVAWKARRLVTIDLGAPLVDLAAGDLDGDGRAELVALTTRDVVVLGARGARGLAEVARAALPAEPPSIQPRDPVGTALVARLPAEIWARASTAGRGARYALAGTTLREAGAIADFPWCAPVAGAPARTGLLVPGRDYFGGDGPARVFAVRCTDELVDESGRALAAVATLGPGGVLDLAIRVRCAPADRACPPERHVAIAGVGAAFAIADVDHDGRPEVIASGDGAPGDPDQVAVYSVPRAGGAAGKPVYRRKFNGGIAGVVAVDVDGDGDLEVVAAVRLAGAARVDLWLLD